MRRMHSGEAWNARRMSWRIRIWGRYHSGRAISKKQSRIISKAIELNPKNHRTWRNLADSYSMVGDSKKQVESYTKAAEILSDTVRVNPKPGTNWATLSFYHAKLGRKSEAEADLKAADRRGLDQRS